MFSRNFIIASRSRIPAPAFLHSSFARPAAQPHTTDSYKKDDTDDSPSSDSLHRVDPNSEVQRPHEPPSGPYSRVGAESAEYMNTNSKYNGDHDRYGGKKQYLEEKGPETSNPDEGPAGKASKGLKPERK
ncbi:hypothetical protein GYMLUDRAFT_32624 [Collybiopsis luxurians FD-317 M1]|nr:hypothetical protein GYMLUDRAFT_32624 [Collybiopsis luxurians FD-317 M1]